MKSFPKTIFVNIEESSGGDQYFEILTEYQFLDKEQKVAIYELKEIKNLKIKKSLE